MTDSIAARGVRPARQRIFGLAALIVVFLFVVYVLPRPAGVKPEGWRLLAIFAATVCGLVLEPLPGGAIVFLGVLASAALGCLTLTQALSGYADSTVWLVQAAFFISRSLIKTGLARRIALVFVRLVGRSSVGVCYALSLSEMVLACIIPSNGALGRGDPAHSEIHRGVIRLEAGTDRRPARILPHDRGLSGRLHRLRHVLHRAGQQSPGGADGGGHRL